MLIALRTSEEAIARPLSPVFRPHPLTAHGRTALRLADGMLEWRLAELPVNSGLTPS
jgi:hypothetical protein